MGQVRKRKKIIFINRFFYPDYSATSQMLSDLAEYLVTQGYTVLVVTSRQCYEQAGPLLKSREEWNGVIIHRVWSTHFGRENLAGRSADYLSFYVAAAWALIRLSGPGTVLVAKTDPPLLSLVAAIAARLRNVVLVNWVQDLFPEVAAGLLLPATADASKAHLMRNLLGFIFKRLQHLRDWSISSARYNVAIGELMRKRLLSLFPERNFNARVRVIPNWADGQAIQPLDSTANRLRAEWLLDAKFVVAYSGNLGRAHEIATLLRTIDLLRHDAAIIFLFIGGGAHLRTVQEECARRALVNVFFKPYQARSLLPLSLSVADAHVVSLLPQMEGLIVPSKFYGVLAAGRPCLFVGAEDGEIAALIRTAECGFAVPVGDADALAARIRLLAADPQLCKRLGASGRRYFEQHFDRSVALRAWNNLFRDLEAS